MERSSWIRRMFEIGIQLRKERGAENVFDFSLGQSRCGAARGRPGRAPASRRPSPRPHSHGYMPNAGFPEVRARIAARLAERTGLPFHGDDIIMTNGAAGAINTVLKAILDPGDEVIVLNPVLPRVPLLHRESRRPRGAGGDGRALPARHRAHRRRDHAAHQGARS